MRKDLQQLFNEFLYEAEFVRKVRPNTLLGYLNTFRLFIKIVPDASLNTLSSASLTEFFKVLQKRQRVVGKGHIKTGLKKSSAASYWSKLNMFFGWLLLKGYININPFDKLSYPTPSYDDRKFLKKEDIEKIITAVHTHHDNNIFILKRNLVLFYILLFCGLRREEVMLLQIRDIDLEKKILTVRGNTSKSGRSRQLPLHSTTLMYLKDYLATRSKYTTPYLIVSSKQDKALALDSLKGLVNKIKEHSGVSFYLHQFRHTFAVNFLNSSNNIAKLKQLLGHKSIAMTMIYLRCLPVDELRNDIETMSIDKMI